MKILLERSERLVVVVPTDLGNTAMVSVIAEPDHNATYPIADLVVEDGLIGRVTEHVCRRHASRVEEQPAKLWAHLVSMHATMLSPETPLADLIEIHEHEHDGPGTIRNHPRELREYSLHKIGKVLSEAEPDVEPTNTEHEYLASYSGGREVGCHLCRKPRSEHK